MDFHLSDEELSHIANSISSLNMTTIAKSYLRFNQAEVDTIRDECRSNENEFKQKILIKWRNKHSDTGNSRLVGFNFSVIIYVQKLYKQLEKKNH